MIVSGNIRLSKTLCKSLVDALPRFVILAIERPSRLMAHVNDRESVFKKGDKNICRKKKLSEIYLHNSMEMLLDSSHRFPGLSPGLREAHTNFFNQG